MSQGHGSGERSYSDQSQGFSWEQGDAGNERHSSGEQGRSRGREYSGYSTTDRSANDRSSNYSAGYAESQGGRNARYEPTESGMRSDGYEGTNDSPSSRGQQQYGRGQTGDGYRDSHPNSARGIESAVRQGNRSPETGYGGDSGYESGSYRRNNYSGQSGNGTGNYGGDSASQGDYGQSGHSSQQRGAGSGSASMTELKKRNGPKGYKRSDDRVRDEVVDTLLKDSSALLDEIEITVKDGVVTLAGVVDSRRTRHHIEDLADGVWGVKEVANNLKVSSDSGRGSQSSGSSSSSRSGESELETSDSSSGKSANGYASGSTSSSAGSTGSGSTSGAGSSGKNR